MPSILPEYEYDIFISYRHNDNRTSGITEFVEHLKAELAATLKEPLSIYFDTNPHDGLLETHDVDKSLERKLKCLIFIPIISQTYCDPKSFAWQHEFCAFNKLAKEDSLGRDVLLSNGNVASRILPIKIHELDAEDTANIESEIGRVLRAIEFIYKEPGVNRPLKITDERNNNQNQTDYGNQVNKVANAIKEIIVSLNPSNKSLAARIEDKIVHPTKSTRKLGAVISVIVLLLALAGYFIYPKVIPATTATEIGKSIAVLPFVDMSPNKDQEYLGDGIAEEILNVLARVKDLKVIGRTSSFSFKGKDIDLKTIGEELGVSTILEGSIRKDGNKVRITAQFIKAADGSHLWSESFDRELKDIFQIQDELAKRISTSLLTTFNSNVTPFQTLGPASNEAYNLYLLGKYQFDIAGDPGEDRVQRLYEAINLLNQSIELDSSFTSAYAQLAKVYLHFGFLFGNQEIANTYELAEKNALKALTLDHKNAEALEQMGYLKRNRDWDWEASRNYYFQALSISPNSERIIRQYALLLSAINKPDSAIFYANRALELNPNSDECKVFALRTNYYARNYSKAIAHAETIKELHDNSSGYLLRSLIQADKNKAVEFILANSTFNNSIQNELLTVYKVSGWNAFINEVYSIEQSDFTIFILAAPREAIFSQLSEDTDNKVGMMVYLLVDPIFDDLRSDPRFNELLRKMGLDKYK